MPLDALVWNMVLWLAGLVGLGFGVFGLHLLLKAIRDAKGGLRTSLWWFFWTDASYIAYNVIAIFLGFSNIPTTHAYWDLVIIVHAIPALTWTASMYLLYKLAREANE